LSHVLRGSSVYVAVLLHAFVTVVARWDTSSTGVWAWLPYALLPVTPIALADAILRHQLLDLNLVIRRSLVYTFLTLTLAGTFVVLQGVAGSALQSITGATSLAGQTLAALAVAALFTPTERRIARLVERLFNRSQLQRLDHLYRLGDEIDRTEDAAGLQQALVERLVQCLELERAALYWLDVERGAFRRVFPDDEPGMERGAELFSRHGRLAIMLSTSRAPFEPAQLRGEEGGPGLGALETASLEALGVALCVPMSARGALAGFLLLGAHRDREPFSTPEKEALSALGSLAARALQHAETVHRLRELERELAALPLRRHGTPAGSAAPKTSV
jgi:GAF domain-containing protein